MVEVFHTHTEAVIVGLVALRGLRLFKFPMSSNRTGLTFLTGFSSLCFPCENKSIKSKKEYTKGFLHYPAIAVRVQKTGQRIIFLQTGCSKSVHKLLSCSHCLSVVTGCQKVRKTFSTTCGKSDGTIRLVRKLFQQD
jgi:hypothetical protein